MNGTCCRCRHSCRIRHLRNTEVCHLHLAVTGHNNILGLDISVNNSILMGRTEAGSDLNRNIQCFSDIQLALHINIILQCNSLNQFHNNEINAVIFPNIIYIHNVRMR